VTSPAGESWFDEDAGHLVRPYAITRGRTRPVRHDFALITLVVTADARADSRHLEPEAIAILDLCRNRALAVAEIAAHLDLPVSVVKVLLDDLLDASMILTRAPAPVAADPDVRLLQKVIDGIRRL
jgi:Protein of unknown function (DUF742)